MKMRYFYISILFIALVNLAGFFVERGIAVPVHAASSCSFDTKEGSVGLFAAIFNGAGAETIEALVDRGHAVNARDERGNTPLMAAAEFGGSAEVMALIKRGAEIDAVNEWGKTALMLTTNYDMADNAKVLISSGAKVNAIDRHFKMTALLYAARHGCTRIAKMLIDAGADTGSVDIDGSGALALAVRHNNPGTVKFLLERKFGPDGLMIPAEGETLLMYAAGKGMADVVKALLAGGADANKKSLCGYKAITYAATSKVAGVWDVVMEKTDIMDTESVSASLMFAAISNNDHAIGGLLKKGAVPDVKYKPLEGARSYESDITGRLFERAINNGVLLEREMTPLVAACVCGSFDAVRALVDGGAGIDSVRAGCHTPLMIALNYERRDIAEYLIGKGADVNARNSRGETPLILAAYLGDSAIVKRLLARGAKVSTPDRHGESAPLIAFGTGDEELIGLFGESGADMKKIVLAAMKDDIGPLDNVINSQNSKMLKTLLKYGVPLNKKSRYGFTPLASAVRTGNYSTVKALLDAGADVNFKDEGYSENLVGRAIDWGHGEIVRLLMEHGCALNAEYLSASDSSLEGLAGLKRELDLDGAMAYSDKPWNTRGFPEKLRKIIIGGFTSVSDTRDKKIIREKLPPSDIENVDVTDRDGNTALMCLIMERAPERLVKLLIDSGADLNVKNKRGDTPLFFAMGNGNRKIYEMLIDAGVRIDIDEERISRFLADPEWPEDKWPILLDIARRMKFRLTGGEALTEFIASKSDRTRIEYFYNNFMFGLDAVDSKSVELFYKKGRNVHSGLLIARLAGMTAADTFAILEKCGGLTRDTRAVMISALGAGNYSFIDHLVNRSVASKNECATTFLSICAEYGGDTLEAEMAELMAEYLDGRGYSIADNVREAAVSRLVYDSLVRGAVDKAARFAGDGLISKTGVLSNKFVYLAGVTNDQAVREFLLKRLPEKYIKSINDRVRNNDGGSDRAAAVNTIEIAVRKMSESIESGNTSEFKNSYAAVGSGVIGDWSVRGLFTTALGKKDHEAAKFIIDREKDFFGKRYVEDALQKEEFEIADYARTKGAKIENPGSLYIDACRDGKGGVIDYLLAAGADPNAGYFEDKPLAFCLQIGKTDIFRKLIEHGADIAGARPDPGQRDFFGNSGKFNCFGMQPARMFEDWTTLLHYALSVNKREAALILAAREPGVNLSGVYGKRPLELAIERNYTDVALAILERGDLDLGGAVGRNALETSVFNENYAVAKALCEKGVRPLDEFSPAAMKRLIAETPDFAMPLIYFMVSAGRSPSNIFSDLQGAGASSAEILLSAINAGSLALVKQCVSRGVKASRDEKYIRRSFLLAAVREGNASIVDELLKAGADPNEKDAFKRPMIAVAVAGGNAAVVKALVENGADINAFGAFDSPALYAAARRGDSGTVKYLLSVKADATKTILKIINNADAETLRFLLEHGAPADACDVEGVNALALARAKRQYEAEQLLLKHGAKENYSRQVKPIEKLFDILKNGKEEELAMKLLSSVDDPDGTDENGIALITRAMENYKYKNFARALVNKGASLDARDENGRTVLMRMLEDGWFLVDDIGLLKKFGRLDGKARDGKNALFFCARVPATVIRALVRGGCDVNAVDTSGVTPLTFFIERPDTERVEILLDLGADVDRKNALGETPLMLAFKKKDDYYSRTDERRLKMIKRLLRASKNVDAVDVSGNTALFYSAAIKDPRFSTAVLEAGADPTVRNLKGETALWNAGGEETALSLMAGGARADVGDVSFRDPEFLSKLIAVRNFAVVRAVIAAGIDKISKFDAGLVDDFLRYGNYDGARALLYIARLKNVSAREIFDLMFKKFDPKRPAALSLVVESGNVELFRILRSSCADPGADYNADAMVRDAVSSNSPEMIRLALGESPRVKPARLAEIFFDAAGSGNKAGAALLFKAMETGEIQLHGQMLDAIVRLGDTECVDIAIGATGLEARKKTLDDLFIRAVRSKNLDSSIYIARKYSRAQLLEKIIDGSPLIHNISESGNIEFMRYLLSLGANIDLRHGYGETPLHKACRAGNIKMFKFLVESGANVKLCNSGGEGVFSLIDDTEKIEFLEYMKGRGLDILGKDNSGKSALFTALYSKNEKLVKYLIEAGADVENDSYGGQYPLSYAIQAGMDESAAIIAKKIKDKTRLLGQAVMAGWFEIVKEAVGSGASPDAKLDGSPLAVLAAKHGKLEILRWLITKKADIDACDNDGNPPLYYACSNADKKSFRLLVESGAKIDFKNKRGSLPIIVAAQGGDIEIFEFFRQKGQDFNYRNYQGNTAFLIALARGNKEMARHLIDLGADVDLLAVFDGIAYHSLVLAVNLHDVKLLKQLIERKIKLNGPFATTALLNAIAARNFDSVDLLLKNGVDVNRRNISGDTPLVRALNTGVPDMVKMIVRYGAFYDPDSPGGKMIREMTARQFPGALDALPKKKTIEHAAAGKVAMAIGLNAAIARKDLASVEKLVASGYEVNVRDENSNTPLKLAIETGSMEIVKYLIGKGADVNLAGFPDDSPMQCAVSRQDAGIMDLLKAHGADLNYMNAFGSCPLFNALIHSNKNAFNFLIANGADPNIRGYDGKTPLIYAAESGMSDAVDMLISLGCDVNAVSVHGLTAIAAACDRGFFKIAEKLRSKGAKLPDEKKRRDQVELCLAINSKNTAALEKLIKSGADVNVKSSAGITPLIFALREKKFKIARLLVENGADPDIASPKIDSPKFMAAISGDEALISAFKKRGVDLNEIIDRDAINNFIIALSKRDEKLALRILDGIRDVNSKLPGGVPMLFCAPAKVPESVMKKLFERGLDINAVNSQFRSLLHERIRNGAFDAAKTLIRYGADPNVTDKQGINVLMEFCRARVLWNSNVTEAKQFAELMLKSMKNINEPDKNGNTALHHAAECGNREAVIWLLNSGADFNRINILKATPLDIIARTSSCDAAVAKRLIERGARFFRQPSPILDRASIKKLSEIPDPVIAVAISEELVKCREAVTASLMAETASSGSMNEKVILARIALLKDHDPRTVWDRLLSGNDIEDPGFARLMLDFGVESRMEFFRKKGVRFDRLNASGTDLKKYINNGNMAAFDTLLAVRPKFTDDGAIDLIYTAIRSGNQAAAKSIVKHNEAMKATTAATVVSVFIEPFDTDGIELVCGVMRKGKEWKQFHDYMISNVLYRKELGPERIAGFIAYLYRDSKEPLDRAASGHIDMALHCGRKDVALKLDDMARNGRSRYNSYLLTRVCNDPDMAKKLLDRGADPRSTGMNGSEAICEAANVVNASVIKLLASRGASLGNGAGPTALSNAIYRKAGNDVLALLLSLGADVNVPAENGDLPLKIAVYVDEPRIVEFLLDHGARVDARSAAGRAVFKEAEKKNDPRISMILKRRLKKADMEAKITAANALAEMVKSRDVEGLKRELKKKPDLNFCDGGGRAPLDYAVEYGYIDIVSLLVSSGADPNLRTFERSTPLITAARNARHRIVKYLLEKGAKTTLRNQYGSDALMNAVVRADGISCHYLVNAGATETYGPTEWDHILKKAASCGRSEIIELLRERSSSEVVLTEKFLTRRELSRNLITAFANDDTSGVEVILRDAKAGCVSADLVTMMIESSFYEDGDTMSKVLAGALTDIEDVMRPMYLYGFGAGYERAFMAFIEGLPDVIFKENMFRISAHFLDEQSTFNPKAFESILSRFHNYVNDRQLLMAKIMQAATFKQNANYMTALKYFGNVSDPWVSGFFADAIESGDAPVVAACKGITNGYDATPQLNDRIMRIIGSAARRGNADLVKFFAAKFPNFRSREGCYMVGEAAQAGRDDLLDTLFELGVEFSSPGALGSLRGALKSGNYKVAGRFIEHGADPDARDDRGRTALMHAAAANDTKLALSALRKGANISLVDDTGETALEIAISLGRREAADLIRDFKGARKVDVHDVYFMQRLFMSADGEKLAVDMIGRGYDIDGRDMTGETALHKAVRFGRKAASVALIRAGASLHARSDSGATPAALLMKNGSSDFVASVNDLLGPGFRFPDGSTLLEDAVRAVNHEAALTILRSGASSRASNNSGVSPLSLARDLKNAEMVKYMEDTHMVEFLKDIDREVENRLASVSIESSGSAWKSSEASEALAEAVRKNQTLRSKYLLATGSDPDYRLASGSGALDSALKNNNIELIKLINLFSAVNKTRGKIRIETSENMLTIVSTSSVTMISRPRNLADEINQELYSVVSFPSEPPGMPGRRETLSCREKIKKLVERGANVNHRSPFGNTVLIDAIVAGNFEAARALVECGADINLKGRNSLGAFGAACMHGQAEIIKFLVDKGVNPKGMDGAEGLVSAAATGRRDVVDLLLSLGTSVNSKEPHGWTALAVSVKGTADPSLTRALVERGADVNSCAGDSNSVLLLAVECKKYETVKYLVEKGALICPDPSAKNGPLTAAYVARNSSSDCNRIFELLLERSAGRELGQFMACAVNGGDLAMVKKCVEKGFDVNSSLSGGTSALMQSILLGNYEIFNFLVIAGADLQAPVREGKTPLILAAELSRDEFVKTLVERGVDIKAKDSSGKTALDHARSNGSARIVKMLESSLK